MRGRASATMTERGAARGARRREARTAGEDARTRRILCVGFGVLWLVDGALQFMPFRGYDTLMILGMGGWGQPVWLISAVDALINFIYRHGLTEAFSLTLGIVQAGIGALVLLGPQRRLGRLGLYASMPAAVAIWAIGEWLGGLAGFWNGGITFVNGGPGAVLLYLLGAWIALPAGRVLGERTLSRLRRVTGGLWVLGALIQSAPAHWAGGLSQSFYSVQVLTRQGPWVRPIAWVVASTAAHNAAWNALFVAVMLTVGLGLLLRRDGPALYALAGLWVLFVWWIGENFGAMPGLVTTDPNSGPAWAVLLLPLFLAWLRARSRAEAGRGAGSEQPA